MGNQITEINQLNRNILSSSFMRNILLLFMTLLVASCVTETKISEHTQELLSLDLIKVINLDAELSELSGIDLKSNANLFVAIEDESGVLYYIDQNGKTLKKEDFFKSGDYEGIAILNDTSFIVRSDGVIFKSYLSSKGNHKVKKYLTPLTDNNDIEGLAVHHSKEKLILLCKKNISLNETPRSNHEIGWYEWDLATETLSENPTILTLPSGWELNPSSLHYDTQDSLYYLLCSKPNLLLTIDPQYKIESMYQYDQNLLPQAEAITTVEDQIIIGSENKNNAPKICIFKKPRD